MNKADQAVSVFMKGYNCSQSVFSAFAEQFGIERETALKIAGGFGGGMGRMGEVCGALTGAFMAIGLQFSEGLQETPESKVRMYEKIQELAARFKSRHGSIRCIELLGCDISTPEGHDVAVEQNLFKLLCMNYIRDAAGMLDNMLYYFNPDSSA